MAISSMAILAKKRPDNDCAGDDVNYASHIEEANKKYGTRLPVRESAYHKVRLQAHVSRKFGNISLMRKRGKHTLYEIVGVIQDMTQDAVLFAQA